MTRTEALAIAQANRAAYHAADFAHMLGKGPAVEFGAFGHKHGWYMVDNFSFSDEEVTGIADDPDQGGWAHL